MLLPIFVGWCSARRPLVSPSCGGKASFVCGSRVTGRKTAEVHHASKETVRAHRRRTNAEWSALTRAAVLSAARNEFSTLGYEDSSLDTIAASASMTKGSIYHHFRSKRALFEAVFVDIERQMVDDIDRIAKSAPTYVAGILQGCEAFLDTVLKQGVARIVLTDAPSVLGWATWRAIDNEIGGRSLRVGLEAAVKAGEIIHVDADGLTTLISGALNEAALTIVDSKDPQRERRRLSRTLRCVFERLCVARPKF